jgi:heme b synthase
MDLEEMVQQARDRAAAAGALGKAEAPDGHPGHPGTTGHPGGHAGAHPAGRPGAHPGAGSHPGAGGHPGTSGHPGSHAGSAAGHGYRPGGGEAARAFEARTGIKAPRIVAWEITRSCNLSCAHCRAAAEFGAYPGELTLDECKAVIDDIATISNPILILTGGEPFMRPDIWEIVDYARAAGCMPVIGTNGTTITDEIAEKMAEHGIRRISVSLDFPTAEQHDAFRGQQGSFDEAVAGIRRAQEHGVGVQVNTTVTARNANLMEQMHDLAQDLGAEAFHPFLLVPTGRGESLRDIELTPDEYEEVLTWAYYRQKTSPLHFKPTDAPQYYRIAHQMACAEGSRVTAEQYGTEAMTRGCLGGITFVFISHVGDVQPCGYFDMQLGNVKQEPFSHIWEHSPVFDDLRHYDRLRGKCGACEYKGVCGGCRARALSATGNYMDEEPYCAYVPKRWRKAMDAGEDVADLEAAATRAAKPTNLTPEQMVSRSYHMAPANETHATCPLEEGGRDGE